MGNSILFQNIDKWVSEAKHGVIYFSLGSMIKAKTMKKEKLEAFQNAFRRLPQRVLWKWENESMDGKPDNVMIQKWMPQFDILSMYKKLFDLYRCLGLVVNQACSLVRSLEFHFFGPIVLAIFIIIWSIKFPIMLFIFW